jgi:hypothetical protein
LDDHDKRQKQAKVRNYHRPDRPFEISVTFIGQPQYFFQVKHHPPPFVLSGICGSRPGAAGTFPCRDTVEMDPFQNRAI